MNQTRTFSLILLFALVCCLNAPAADTGIEGVIAISPIHGGPVREGMPTSKPLANTAFVVENNSGIVKSFTTDERGGFHISLPPGRYTVRKEGWTRGIGKFGPFDVEVTPGKMTKVEWECDSGMR